MKNQKRIKKQKICSSSGSGSSRRRRNWSDLPPDILVSISSRLSFIDTLSFSGVCSSWRVASKQFSNRKSFPLLFFFIKPPDPISRVTEEEIEEEKLLNRQRIIQRCSNKRDKPIGRLRFKTPSKPIAKPRMPDGDNYDVCLYSINDERGYTPKSVKYSCQNQRRRQLIGSYADGSLVVWDHFFSPFFLKLIPNFNQSLLNRNVVWPDGKTCKNAFIRKLIFSVRNPSLQQPDDLDMIAMMNYSSTVGSELAFYRPGGRMEWRVLGGESYSDIAFCYDTSTLYALKIVSRFEFVSVEAWDFSQIGSGLCLPKKKLSFEVSCLSGCMSRGDYYCHTTRLVVHPITGELLLLAYVGTHKDDLNTKWLILNVDFSQMRCKEVHSFNGEVLLLSYTSSIFLSSNDVHQHRYRPDSVYFSDWWALESASKVKLRNYSIKDAQVHHIWDSHERLAIGFSWMVLSI